MGSQFNAATSGNAVSEWFVTALAENPLPLDHLVAALDVLRRDGKRSQCEEWADRLLNLLVEQVNPQGVVRVLDLQSRIVQDPVKLKQTARQALGKVMVERLHLALVEGSGLEGTIAPAEALRRLRVLMVLREGAFCRDKTWGFGVVKRVDEFYKKVTIDFNRKPAHQMTFAYAGESLQIVGPEHLLAVKHTRPAELAAIAKDRPDEIIKLALRSYGPFTVVQLQELCSEEGLDGGDWKSFWDRARKQLKQDGMVDIPTKRSEPLRLLATAKQYDATWFAALQKERDIKTILERIAEWERAGDAANLPPAHRQIMAERLAFGVKGAEDRQAELAARLVMAGDRIGLADSGFDVAESVRRLMESGRLEQCLTLPAREVKTLLPLLGRHVPDVAVRLVDVLRRLPAHAVHVVLDDLREAGLEGPVSLLIRQSMLARSTTAEVLDYICEHPNLLKDWSLGGLSDLLRQVVGALEVSTTGERYRTQKLLRARFEDKDWFEKTLSALDERERSQFLARVKLSRAWDEASKRSLLGRMIKLYPELGAVLAKAEKAPEEVKEARYTSWRSYRERQEQLRVLGEVSIPQNSKDIAHARAYGDLRENFEYQAAKDQQRLLLRRESELERDLSDVHGTDFVNVPSDRVGMGTGVRLERPDGSQLQYWVLGEWDRDEALNIISNKSEVAKRIEGAAVGDPVTLPDDAAGQTSRVVEILPLNDTLKEWVRAGA